MGHDVPADWYPDPAGTACLRWWDGERWSEATRDPETPSADGKQVQVATAPPAGWHLDPSGDHDWRWWDGQAWGYAVRDRERPETRRSTTPDAGDSSVPATAAPATAETPAQESWNHLVHETPTPTTDQPPAVRTPALTFGQAVSSVFRNYAVFRGRAQRSEFWWFALFHGGVLVLAGAIHPGVGAVVLLVTVLPALSVSVRRMHDIGRSGAWVFWLGVAPLFVLLFALLLMGAQAMMAGFAILVISQIVELVCGIVAIVLFALPGNTEHNAYGPPPAPARTNSGG